MDGRKVPLTDNNIIDQVIYGVPGFLVIIYLFSLIAFVIVPIFPMQELGKFGVVCLEDMVHQIYNAGPHFKEVVKFMWPFVLNKPAEGLKGSKTLYKEGGDTGNREDLINELIDKMN